MGDISATNVKVMVRLRLFNKSEIKKSEEAKAELRPCVKMRGNTCAIVEYHKDGRDFVHEREREAFDFDECFWSMPLKMYPSDKEYATQLYVYQRSGLLALKSALEGFHVCVFAYGQTGSGKTYSMLGSADDAGISPRLVDDLFNHIEHNKNLAVKFLVECVFFEIYNEKVRDLFNKRSKTGDYDPVKIRQNALKGVYIEGLLRKDCTDAITTKAMIEKGTLERAMAETKMNPTSSRSHAIFQIIVTQLDGMKGTKKTSYINLVDLAGSERIRQSQVTGASLVEATNINKSLTTLRRVIDVLIENSTSKKQQVAPFRESVLTYVLSDSLGGNSKTQMIATISPHVSNIEDTISTLRYALRAKSIVCEAKVNEEESAAMMQHMRDEIMRLKVQMREGVMSTEGGGIPEDVQRELAEKEQEMQKMEEEQTKMETVMADLKSQMKDLDLAKQELAVAITEQKRERFASAFRNAFVISSDKKRIHEHEQELTRLREESIKNRRDISMLSSDLREKQEHNEILLKENQHLASGVDNLRDELNVAVAKVEQQQRSHGELKHGLEQQLEDADAKVQELTGLCERQQKRIESLTADLTGLTHTAERESIEKQRIRASFEQTVMDHMKEVELLRKKKESYKQLAAEERQKNNTLQKTIGTHAIERSSLMETLKALQALLKEKDFLVHTANSQCREAQEEAESARRKLEERDATIQALKAALGEHQSAAHQWMSDLSLRDKEIARLNSLTQDSSVRVNADLQRLRDHVQGTSRSLMGSPSSASYGMVSSPGGVVRSGHLPSSVHRASSPRSPPPVTQAGVSVMIQPVTPDGRQRLSRSPVRVSASR